MMSPSPPPAAPPGGAAMPAPLVPSPDQGGPVTIDAVVALLRDDCMRGFRIDVETDSMIETDQLRDRKDRTEFVGAVGQFLTQLGPIVQVQPLMAPMVGGLLKFAARGFKVGAELEELIEKTMDQMAQAMSQPKPPQVNPTEQIKLDTAKVKAQAEGTKAQLGVQQEQIKTQGVAQRHEQTMQAGAAAHNRDVAMHQIEEEALRQQHLREDDARRQLLEQQQPGGIAE